MGLPGYGTVVGVIARIVDTLWPSKKEALVEQLNALNAKYDKALKEGRDTDAAIYRKQMVELRKKAGFSGDDM